MEFYRGSGCSSGVGQSGGKTSVSIGYGCTKIGIVAHEIGHALGFWHEQSRPDRDNYVSIISQNIRPDTLSNFLKRSYSDIDTSLPYDLGSVMHYGPTAFLQSGTYTIQTLDGNAQNTIGQREELSFIDIKFINNAYCASSCAGSSLTCQHGGYPDPNNCGRCKCPDGFGGNLCERAASNGPTCGSGDLQATTTSQTITKSGFGDCNWLIKAPTGGKVIIDVISATFSEWSVTCSTSYVEIKYKDDLYNTGPRFCKGTPRGPITSETDEALILYRGSGSISIRYRSVGGVIQPITPTAPITIPTTPAPITTPSTPAPITTSPWWTPPPPPTGWSAWGEWSSCTANCGGCGIAIRRRTCGTWWCPGASAEIDKDQCSQKVCEDGSCCPRLEPDGDTCVPEGTAKTSTSAPVTTAGTSTSAPVETTDPPGSTCANWSRWTPCQGKHCGGCGRRFRARMCTDTSTGQSRSATETAPCNFNVCTTGTECCPGMQAINGVCQGPSNDAMLKADRKLFAILQQDAGIEIIKTFF